jgi:S-adenosylmethionine decarboxylase
MQKFIPIHQHLLIKGEISKFPVEPEVANNMLLGLVESIGMVPVTVPQSVYVNTFGNEGLTGSVNLATSHIAYHIFEDRNMLMMDVYSCCAFDSLAVISYLNKFFNFEKVEYVVLDRDAFEPVDGGTIQ